MSIDPQGQNSIESRKGSDFSLIILICYFIFEYARIQDSYAPFLSFLKIPFLLTLLLFILLLRADKKILMTGLPAKMLIFLALVTVHVPFATNTFFAFNTAKGMILTMISCCAVIVLLDTKERLMIFMNAWIGINILIAIWVLTHNGVGVGGFLRDENDACIMMVVALPFSWYLMQLKDNSFVKKLFYLGACTLFVTAVVATFSRGGLLGLAASISIIMWWSKRRLRNIFVSILFVTLVGGIVVQFLPQKYIADMETISDKDDGTRNLRLLHWTTAWEIFKDNPVFGVGPTNYPWESSKYFHLSPYYDQDARNRSGRQSHSLYFTLIPELGLSGSILFFLMVYAAYVKVRNIRQSYEKYDPLGLHGVQEGRAEFDFFFFLASGIGAAAFGFLVAGAFISVLYYPIIWHLFAFIVATSSVFSRTLKPQNTKSNCRIIP